MKFAVSNEMFHIDAAKVRPARPLARRWMPDSPNEEPDLNCRRAALSRDVPFWVCGLRN